MSAPPAPAAADASAAATTAEQPSFDDEYYDSEDDETWEERAWRLLVTKASFADWTYPRNKMPYKKYAPPIPFYMHLGGAGGRRLRVNIPQTVVFGIGPDPGNEDGLQHAWLITTSDGYVRRRDKFNPDVDVLAAFQSDDLEEIVAVFKRRTNGVSQRQLLTSDELKDIVYNRQSYGLFAIQAFVHPRKSRATLSRCVWKKEHGGGGHSFFTYAISNKTSFADTRDRDDLLLDLSVYNCATVNKLRGMAVEDLEELTDGVAQYIQKGMGMLVNDVVCDFVRDERGEWQMLQIKGFRLAAHRGAGANRRIRDFLERDSGDMLPDYSHIVTDGSSALKSKSMTTLHLRGRDPGNESPIDWDGGEAEAKDIRRLLEAKFFEEARKAMNAQHIGHLVRKTPVYERRPPPTLPGTPLTMLDQEAQTACRWCGTRCRTTHLQCTMSLKMIGDAQKHLQQRGVSFSWFDRMDITLRGARAAAPSGSTSTLFSQQSVCHSCYEIYVTEQKLMRAEGMFAHGIGVPVPKGGKGIRGVKHLAKAKDAGNSKLAALEPQEVPDNLQCYRFLTMFGDIEQLPVPLLFGVSGLSLQYTFMGLTTTMPLDVEGSTLHSARLPGATPKETPAGVGELIGPAGSAGHSVNPDASPLKLADGAGVVEGADGEAAAGADGEDAEPQPEPEPEVDPEHDPSKLGKSSGSGDYEDDDRQKRNRYGQLISEADVRVKRSLFSGQAEKLRREKEEKTDSEKKRLQWEKEMVRFLRRDD